MDIKKDMGYFLPAWCVTIPFQIKGMAIKEACNAFWVAKGKPTYRTRKSPEQSCFIPSTAVSKTGIYPRISGKGLFYHEPLPDNIRDSRLIWRFEKWWLAVPHRVQQQRADNQRRVVALDPGIRTFISFFSTECAGKLGEGDFSQIMRLCQHLDNLNSRRAKTKKKSLTKAYRRAVGRIRNKIDELHHKVAKFLVDNFDVILLPTFETKQMTKKINRKIGSKSVRAMLGFAHFRFKQFLKFKAENAGKMVVDCSEAYTSKTHPQTGKIRNIGSTKTIRLTDGSLADRDLIGARNILFRALVDSPVIY
jgi:putative transposase